MTTPTLPRDLRGRICRDKELNYNKVSTDRQVRTAREILKRFRKNGNVLLADDVGTGKTTVAVLVALCYAAAGMRVKIIVPNRILQASWIEKMWALAKHMNVDGKRQIKTTAVKMMKGTILVETSGKTERVRNIDLLIIDEVHRASGTASVFEKYRIPAESGDLRILCLTATPYSIDVSKLKDLLNRIAGGESHRFSMLLNVSRRLKDYYSTKSAAARSATLVSIRECWVAAIDELKPHLIRHAVSDLAPEEQMLYGTVKSRSDCYVEADSCDIKLLVRADRIMQLARKEHGGRGRRNNDPRNHVSWRMLKEELRDLEAKLVGDLLTRECVKLHHRAIRKVTDRKQIHPKMALVVELVRDEYASEKVLIFCYHHATAQDLALHLDKALSQGTGRATRDAWKGRGSVIAVCNKPAGDDSEIFKSNARDAMDEFNRADGARVLVTTDQLSEGVDLHKRCRVLIHYELSPSPVRVLQRNGRVRRINSWAKETGKCVEILYPCFKGSRDERLVRIIRDRLENFDAILGGIEARITDEFLDIDQVNAADELRKTLNGLKDVAKSPFAVTTNVE